MDTVLHLNKILMFQISHYLPKENFKWEKIGSGPLLFAQEVKKFGVS